MWVFSAHQRLEGTATGLTHRRGCGGGLLRSRGAHASTGDAARGLTLQSTPPLNAAEANTQRIPQHLPFPSSSPPHHYGSLWPLLIKDVSAVALRLVQSHDLSKSSKSNEDANKAKQGNSKQGEAASGDTQQATTTASSVPGCPPPPCEMSFKFDFSLSPPKSEGDQHSLSTDDADDDTHQAANASVASYTRKTAEKECAVVDARMDVDLDTFATIDLQGMEGLKVTTACHIRGGPEYRYLKSHDVVPGIYEGGLTVWECSIDMCRYLASVLVEVREPGSPIESDPIMKTALSRALGSGGSALELVSFIPDFSSRVEFWAHSHHYSGLWIRAAGMPYPPRGHEPS